MNDSHKKMSMATTKQAYELTQDVDHLNKLSHDYDAYIVEWPEYLDYGLKFKQPNDFEYPNQRIEFYGYESCLSLTEYPFNDVSWPIMSRRMLNTLLKVREFPHRTWDIPFVGVPDNTPVKKLEKGLGGGISHDNEFIAVQLLEQLDIFDWEESVYKEAFVSPGRVRSIRELALHMPEDGLPPIFRLKVNSVPLYVSPEGRAALEAAKIKGIRFY
jgi:hypothetical protein